MIKIGSCTVLYNPDDSVIDNIKTYSNLVDVVVIVDNSDRPGSFKQQINDEKFKYISMNGNKGIAAALNVGLRYLNDMNCDFALTMDQDSKFPSNDYYKIYELVKIYSEKYSVLGLNFNYFVENKTTEIVETKYWLTSGNFVNLTDFFELGGFEEKLFIDYVDIEYGHKLFMSGKKLAYLRDYSLSHQIGSPIPIKLFGKVYYAMNHSPIRYYYRYRNSRYLYLTDKDFYKEKYFKEIFINIPKMLLFEKNKIHKLKMICKGLKDAESNLGRIDNE